MRIMESKYRGVLAAIERRRVAQFKQAEGAVCPILEDVRRRGDRALVRYAKEFDGVDLSQAGFTVEHSEIRRAYQQVDADFLPSIRLAARNIRAVARRQLPRPWTISNGAGVQLGEMIRPLGRVACYIPGGRFPLFSTVLMGAIPAQVAGVREIVITSPRPAPAVLVAADFLGIEKVFRLGGAHAIAAFAYGTESVPRADKIVGPGNRYVAAAKRLIAGECGIDFVAGPTELVVVGARGNPQWIAADLVAQAEHDPDAVAILITPSRRLARAVQVATRQVLSRLPASVAADALRRHGAIILTRDLSEAAGIANELAPEHMTLLDGATGLLRRIRSAGSIFLGGSSAVAAGDYASGSNHILPTGGGARLRGGLSAADFVKTIPVQRLTPQGLRRLGRTIVTLASTEGLKAHAYSVETRFKPNGPTP